MAVVGHYSGTSLWWPVWIYQPHHHRMLIISDSLLDPYKQLLTHINNYQPICLAHLYVPCSTNSVYSKVSFLFLLLQNLCSFSSESSCFPLPSGGCGYTFSLLTPKLYALLGSTLSLSFSFRSVTSENLAASGLSSLNLLLLLWPALFSLPCGGTGRATREDLSISVAAMPQRTLKERGQCLYKQEIMSTK